MSKLDRMIDIVKEVLLVRPDTRDDDIILQKIIHYKEFQKLGIPPTEMAWLDYLSSIADGTLSKPESIRRARRKCQEFYPITRGNRYLSRKEKQRQDREYHRDEFKQNKGHEVVQEGLWRDNA